MSLLGPTLMQSKLKSQLLHPNIEAFWAIVQKGTVQEASNILGLTQTGVTQRLRSLEKLLQTTLFLRSRKGMKLTAEGEALLQYVKQSLETEGMALSKIQRAAFEHSIEIGITGQSSILRSRAIPNLLSIHKEIPKIRFRFDLAKASDVSEKLKNGQCDMAILEHQFVTKEMDSKILKPERYKIYIPKIWKKRTLHELVQSESIIDFGPEDELTFNYLTKYKINTKNLPYRHYANNDDAIMAMIVGGLGYSVLTEEFARSCVKSGEIVDLEPTQFYDHKLALAWYFRPQIPGYFKTIIKAIN